MTIELIKNLRMASSFLRENDFDCTFSCCFSNSDEFADALENLANKIELSRKNPILWLYTFYLRKKAQIWFIPTSDWDDVTFSGGNEALELGNKLFEQL